MRYRILNRVLRRLALNVLLAAVSFSLACGDDPGTPATPRRLQLHLEVPETVTPLTEGNRTHVAYELHITNFSRNDKGIQQ